MNISLDDMCSMVQEWFAQVMDYEDLRDIYYTVRSEVDKQFEYIAEAIKPGRFEEKQNDYQMS